MIKIELMSPAGSFESLMAAIKAGCNSIYFGLRELNMRTGRAKNFEIDDLPKIKDICKKAKIKCYITLNSIVYDDELEKVKEILRKVKETKIDAVIASDMAVIRFAMELGMAVHISTQKSISNFEALKHYSHFADRIVLARELSLKQIEEIKKKINYHNIKGPAGKIMEIECFVHGAMCISVSGRCFMSLFEFNCSANRGRCLQSCRREYIVKDAEEGQEMKVSSSCVLSPKDLCTIEFLDKIIGAGVDALKIEGRGRNPDYVYVATKCYREAIEAIKANRYNEKVKKRLANELKTVYNRGFSSGFYLGKPLNDWSKGHGSSATEEKVYVGKVLNYFTKNNVAHLMIEAGSIKKDEDIIITGPTTGYVRIKIDEIRKYGSKEDNEGKAAAKAEKGENVTIKSKEKVRKNDKVFVSRKC